MPLLAIDNPLPSFLMAREPFEFKLSKNDYLGAMGGYAMTIVKIDTVSLPMLATSFTLKWGTGSVTYTYSSTPFSTSNISSYNGEPMAEYCQLIVASLVLNPELSRDYKITYLMFDGTYGYFTIVARQRGSVYNLTITNTTTLSFTNMTVSDDTVYDDEQLNLYLDIITDICYEPVFTRFDDLIAVADSDPDSDIATYTFYEMPALALSLLDADTEIPFSAFFLSRRAFCIIGMNLFSSNVESGVLTDTTFDSWEFTLAYPYIQMALNGANFTPVDPNTNLKNFFTRYPSDIFITEDQPLYLTILLNSLLAGYTLQVVVTYDDTTTATNTYSQTIPRQYATGIAGGILATWPAGYKQLGLDQAAPGKNPVKMTVQLLYWDGSANLPYSQILTYNFDQRFSLYNRYFLLHNSAGGYDTLRVRGINEYETKYQRTTSETVRTSETTPDRGTIQMTYIKEERIWTIRTGWLLGLDELQWLRELLMTTYAAEILLDNGLYAPPGMGQQWQLPLRSVIILQDSVKQYKEDDGMWALEWKMKYADDRYVAGDDTDALAIYMDSEIEANLSVADLSTGCNIMVYADNGALIYFNGVLGTIGMYGYSYFYFPYAELNVNIKIVGYNISIAVIETTNLTGDVAVTKISSPSLNQMAIVLADGNINCNYLMRRLPYLPFTMLVMDGGGYTGSSIDLLLQMMAANFNTFGTLTYLELLQTTPSTDGLNAKAYLTGAGVSVNTY